MPESLGSDYFAHVYSQHDDPWNFATSPYEDLKYRDTLDALPRPMYANVLEIGCSIGVLTQRLALRCERLLATDLSAKALAAAQVRCEALSHVRFEESRLPAEYPAGTFDLTVLSEVGYYWSAEDLARVADGIVQHMAPDGQLILVHWTPNVHDYPLTGDQVHDYFCQLRQLSHLHGHRRECYRLDLFALGA